MKTFRGIYSLGTNCFVQAAISMIDSNSLTKFSSIFSNIDSQTTENVVFHIKDNFQTLMDSRYYTYINENSPFFREPYQQNQKYKETKKRDPGARTFHHLFDDVNNYHKCTFAHHDLSIEEHYNHFKKAINRFNILQNNQLPILFVHMTSRKNNLSLDSSLELVNTLITRNKNAFVLILNRYSKGLNLPFPKFNNEHCLIEATHAEPGDWVKYPEKAEFVDKQFNRDVYYLSDLIKTFQFQDLITIQELKSYRNKNSHTNF